MWIKVLAAGGLLTVALVGCGDPRNTNVEPFVPTHTAAISHSDGDLIAGLYPQCRQVGNCDRIGQMIRTECDGTADQRDIFLGALIDENPTVAVQYQAELNALCPGVS